MDFSQMFRGDPVSANDNRNLNCNYYSFMNGCQLGLEMEIDNGILATKAKGITNGTSEMWCGQGVDSHYCSNILVDESDAVNIQNTNNLTDSEIFSTCE